VLASGKLIAQGGLFFAVRGAPRPWPEGRVLAWTSTEEAGHVAAGAGRFPRHIIGSIKVCVAGAGRFSRHVIRLFKVFVAFWSGDAVTFAGSSRRRGAVVVYVRVESGANSKRRDLCARD
jgi:hypothetical protein